MCSYLLILPQLILLASLVALASALPRPDVGDPFLSVSIVRPGQSSVQTDVSRQAVSIRQSGEYVADREEYSPYVPHKPPFLALPPIKGHAAYQTAEYFPNHERYPDN